ncbi:Outer membrane protein OprJ [bioreactor metagenome]|uniref:Outer membrane protein OprJ n=1 Tax=bioreactor metagenome TaxID=1076179 RepID=A0A645DYG8_9ZZZZ
MTNALDIARLRADAAATEAQMPLIEAQVDALTAQLAVLTGTTPAALAPELARPRAVPRPPRKVAVGNPADMLRRRPDIREAERRLAASSAAIGETAASFFPKITFMGLVSTAGGTPGAVLRSDGLGLAVGPVLQWNALDFGRKDAALAQAAGVRDEALAGYRQTVLAALADAEGSLSAYEKRRRSVARLAEASAEAARATELAAQMAGAGTLSVIDQLDIQRAQLQIDLALSQGRTELATAYIGLNKSLGLGWAPAPPPLPMAEVAQAAMAKAP